MLIGLVIMWTSFGKRSYGADELAWGLFPQCELVYAPYLRLAGPSFLPWRASRVRVKH